MMPEGEGHITIVVSDLEVLSDKCSRDIKDRLGTSAELYREEYNRILDEAKKTQLDNINDINPIARKRYIEVSEPDNEFAKLQEVDATTSKLLARLKTRIRHEGKEDILYNLERIFRRFQQVARQISRRHDSRQTLYITDEYDVQDLLHALLRIYYDDIRPEEWTPSYAGSSSRMDFLLKEEQVVVETKKARDNLRDKEVGKELMIDIQKYSEHPDCKSLVCFVYDPDGKIANPIGLENDLNKLSNENMQVNTFVFPK